MSSVSLPVPARTPSAVIQFRVVYALLAANFILPAISYVVSPGTAIDTLDRVNRALGGGPYLIAEGGQLWHMLAVSDVLTLGFLCVLLLADLRRFQAALPGLLFLKGTSALQALVIGFGQRLPVFLAIAVLDGTTTLAMWLFARRALRSLLPVAASP